MKLTETDRIIKFYELMAFCNQIKVRSTDAQTIKFTVPTPWANRLFKEVEDAKSIEEI